MLLMISLSGTALFECAQRAERGCCGARCLGARAVEVQNGHGAVYGRRKSYASVKAIVSVSTDDAASAELHQMTMTKMMMVMTPVSQVSVPAKGKTSFDPNNFHVMLFGLKTGRR